jgi:hypothetical protein
MIVEKDLETKEEKEHHSKSLFGKNMSLKNKHYESFMGDTAMIDAHSKIF